MRRHLTTLALAGLFAGFVLSSDASACCHKKKKCATPCEVVVAAPAPAPVCAPAPVVCEAPAKKKCCFKMPKMGGHKKAAACETVAYAPSYAPTYAPSYASPQASGQGM